MKTKTDDFALPELPERFALLTGYRLDKSGEVVMEIFAEPTARYAWEWMTDKQPLYTADQMKAYAKEAVAKLMSRSKKAVGGKSKKHSVFVAEFGWGGLIVSHGVIAEEGQAFVSLRDALGTADVGQPAEDGDIGPIRMVMTFPTHEQAIRVHRALTKTADALIAELEKERS